MALAALISCKMEPIGQTPVDGVAPSPVSNVHSVPTPGGANIYYTLPEGESDILYVLCEYEQNGVRKETRASVFADHLTVEGFVSEEPVDFALYVVDTSGNRSKGVKSVFVPEEAPISAVFKTIIISPDFGGASITWDNPSEATIGAFLLARDDAGEWQEYDLVYSSLAHPSRSMRGYSDVEREFGVRLTDKFGNFSDTCKVTLTPLYEKLLNKKLFSNGHLQGDNNTTTPLNPRPIENIWDGNLSVLWHTNASAGFIPPQYFTINLGVEAALSRMVLFNRGENQYEYGQHNPRLFEVWGTSKLSHEEEDSYWTTSAWRDEWKQLGDFEVVKPSGLPAGQTTDEDIAAHNAGFEFRFNPGSDNIRYLRFVVKETWAKTAALHINEISIYGNDGSK